MNNNIKNSFWLSFQYVLAIIVSIVGLKVNLLTYNNEIFDIWIIALSFWNLLAFIDFGLPTSLIRSIAEYYHKFQFKKLNILFSSVYVVYIISLCILIPLAITLCEYLYLTNEQIIKAKLIYQSREVFYILSFSFIFNFLSKPYRSVLEGINNYYISAKVSIVQNVLILVSVLTCWLIHLDIKYLALGYSLSTGVMFLLLIYFNRKICPEIKISLNNLSFKEIRLQFQFSLFVQLATFSGAMIDPSVKYILAVYLPSGYVTYYEVARRTAVAISGLFGNVFRTLIPKTSILSTFEEQTIFLKTEAVKISKFGQFFSASTVGIGGIIISFFIQSFYGFEKSVMIFYILGATESFNNFGIALYYFMFGAGKSFQIFLLQTLNLIFTSVFVFVAIYVGSFEFSFIGFYVSQCLITLSIVCFIANHWELKFFNYLIDLGYFSLIKFQIVIFVSLIQVLFTHNIYYSSIIITILCTLFYWKQFKEYKMIIKRIIFH